MCASLRHFAATVSWHLSPVTSLFKVWFFRISSELISALLNLNSANFYPLSSHLISRCVFSAFFTSSHFISSHVFSPFLSSSQWSQRIILIFSHVIWAFLISSAHLSSSLFSSSQLLHSTQLVSAQLFSALLSSLSDHLNSFLAQNLLQHRISALKPKKFDFEAFLKAKVKGKWKAPKTSKNEKKHQKLILATLTQAFQCGLQAASRKRPWNYVRNSSIEQQWRNQPNAIRKQRATLRAHQRRRATVMQPQCTLHIVAPGGRSQ